MVWDTVPAVGLFLPMLCFQHQQHVRVHISPFTGGTEGDGKIVSVQENGLRA